MAEVPTHLRVQEDLRRHHSDVPWVQRILNPSNYPVIKKGDKDQTVLLGTVEMDGTHWVVPDIVYDGEKLVKRKPGEDRMEWMAQQVKAGNAVPFDTAEEAASLAEGSWKPPPESGRLESALSALKDDYVGPIQQALGSTTPLSALKRLLFPSALPDYDPQTEAAIEPEREGYLGTAAEGAWEGSGVAGLPALMGALSPSTAAALEAAPYLLKQRPYPLSPAHGNYGAAFAADNPYTAASYAGAEWQSRWLDAGFPEGKVPSGTIYPMRLEPSSVVEIPTEGPAKVPGKQAYGDMGWRSRGQREWPRGFTTKARELRRGEAQVARGVLDPGGMESLRHDPQRFSDLPGEQWAYGEGVKVRPAGPGMTYAEVAQLGEDAAKRLGIDLSDYPIHGSRVPGEQWAYGESYLKGVSDEDAERIIKEIENDPRFKGQRGKLLFRGLSVDRPGFAQNLKRFYGATSRGVGEALRPVPVFKGVLQGMGAGALGAVPGRIAGELETTQTGGTVTPPHPSYLQEGGEGLESRIQSQEENRERWRGHLLNRAIDELGMEAVEGLVPQSTVGGHPYRLSSQLDDIRAQELIELLDYPDVDLRAPAPTD